MIIAGFQGHLLNSAPLITFCFYPTHAEAALISLTSPYVALSKPLISADSKFETLRAHNGPFTVHKVQNIIFSLIFF